MGSIAYVRWFLDDWSGGTRHMNRVQRGAYHDLLMEQIHEHESKGLTMEQIKHVLGDDFSECWPALERKFRSDDGVHYKNRKMQDEIDRYLNYSASRSRNRSKKNKLRGKHMKNICKSHDEHMGTGTGTSFSSSFGGKSAEKGTSWKTDLNVYLAECKASLCDVLRDEKWIAQQERLNPGLDIRLSLEKALVNFWGTEAGWKHKKAKGRRSASINWPLTWANALSMTSNKVWLPRDQRQGQPTGGRPNEDAYKPFDASQYGL